LDPLGHFDTSPGCWPSLAACPGRAMWGGGLRVPGPVYTSVMILVKARKMAAGVGIQSGLQIVWAPYVLYPGIVPYRILV
jgi:hypothetical protein